MYVLYNYKVSAAIELQVVIWHLVIKVILLLLEK